MLLVQYGNIEQAELLKTTFMSMCTWFEDRGMTDMVYEDWSDQIQELLDRIVNAWRMDPEITSQQLETIVENTLNDAEVSAAILQFFRVGKLTQLS